MNPALRKRLIQASTGGALAIAAVLIQWHEGLRTAPYHDGGGVLTACYGHTGPDVVPGKHYTEAECHLLLNSDLRVALAVVERSVTPSLTETQKAALASFVYNIGSAAFARSTLLKKLNRQMQTVAALDSQYTRELEHDKNRIAQLERDVAAGRRRLRVKGNCSVSTTRTGSLGHAETIELSSIAGRNVLDIRAGIISDQEKIKYLQDYIRIIIHETDKK